MRQIAAGKPLNMTHANMRGYFMTTAEAVQLALAAAATGRPEEIFVLDMGPALRILDLLTDSLKLAGQKPDGMCISYSGIRPGERLHEEIFLETEIYQAGSDSRILIAVNTDVAEAETVAQVVSFALQAQARSPRTHVLIAEQPAALPYKADKLFSRDPDAGTISALGVAAAVPADDSPH